MCASSIAVRSENGMSREDLLNDRDAEEVDPEAAAADDYELDEGEHEASAHHASAPVPEAKENEPVGAEGLDLSDAVTFSPEGQGQGDRHLIPATQDFPLTQPEADESAEMAEESGVGIGNEPEDIDGTEVPQDEVLEEAPEMSAASEPYLNAFAVEGARGSDAAALGQGPGAGSHQAGGKIHAPRTLCVTCLCVSALLRHTSLVSSD